MKQQQLFEETFWSIARRQTILYFPIHGVPDGSDRKLFSVVLLIFCWVRAGGEVLKSKGGACMQYAVLWPELADNAMPNHRDIDETCTQH